jgi:hypothetical protein
MYNLIIHQQLWGYKVEEKLYLGVREQKMLYATGLYDVLRLNPGHDTGYPDMFFMVFLSPSREIYLD